MSSNGPSKTSGQYHSVKGTVKNTLGNVLGNESLHTRGKTEHAAGQTECNAARGVGYAEGAGDRVVGKKDQIVGAVTGDRSQEAGGTLSFCYFPRGNGVDWSCLVGNVQQDKGGLKANDSGC